MSNCYYRWMSSALPQLPVTHNDICTLEADLAFFEARLSLAGEAPDSAYQRAQIKTYQTLVALIGEILQALRRPPQDRPEPPASRDNPVD